VESTVFHQATEAGADELRQAAAVSATSGQTKCGASELRHYKN